jgi:PSP1 C-terminal conserved region
MAWLRTPQVVRRQPGPRIDESFHRQRLFLWSHCGIAPLEQTARKREGILPLGFRVTANKIRVVAIGRLERRWCPTTRTVLDDHVAAGGETQRRIPRRSQRLDGFGDRLAARQDGRSERLKTRTSQRTVCSDLGQQGFVSRDDAAPDRANGHLAVTSGNVTHQVFQRLGKWLARDGGEIRQQINGLPTTVEKAPDTRRFETPDVSTAPGFAIGRCVEQIGERRGRGAGYNGEQRIAITAHQRPTEFCHRIMGDQPERSGFPPARVRVRIGVRDGVGQRPLPAHVGEQARDGLDGRARRQFGCPLQESMPQPLHVRPWQRPDQRRFRFVVAWIASFARGSLEVPPRVDEFDELRGGRQMPASRHSGASAPCRRLSPRSDSFGCSWPSRLRRLRPRFSGCGQDDRRPPAGSIRSCGFEPDSHTRPLRLNSDSALSRAVDLPNHSRSRAAGPALKATRISASCRATSSTSTSAALAEWPVVNRAESSSRCVGAGRAAASGRRRSSSARPSGPSERNHAVYVTRTSCRAGRPAYGGGVGMVMAVAFTRYGRLYYLDPGEHAPRVGDKVLVPTDDGPEVAECVWSPQWISEEIGGLPVCAGLAEPEHLDRDERNRRRRAEARVVARRLVRQQQLPMKVVAVDFVDSRSDVDQLITIYFSAPNRVDFRDLVRDLARTLRARIDLRQVGARDEARVNR